MPLRRISSLWTVFNKFILPGLFLLSIVNSFFVWGSGGVFGNDRKPMDLPFLIIPVVMGAFIVWLGWGLKKVQLDVANRRLYVSNFRKEISIQFSEIDDVTEFLLSDPRRITIKLKNPSEFGPKIIFLDTYRFGGWLAGPHPIVAELRALASE